MTFKWIPFYKELAQKLLNFRNSRATLIKWIYGNLDGFLNHLKDDKNGIQVADIDPFTVFAIFNRGITDEKRMTICSRFKTFLNITAPVPEDFHAIPTVFTKQSNFMGFADRRKDGDVDRLWNLFEAAVSDRDISKQYDALNGQFLIKFNITIGLFWIRPDKYLPLDSKCKKTLNEIGLTYDDTKFLPYADYSNLMNNLNDKMKTESLEYKNFVDFSYYAYQQSIKQDGDGRSSSQHDKDMVAEPASPTDKVNYWWLVANPSIWSLAGQKIGEERKYSLFNDKGRKRRIFNNFVNAKKGDVVIGYESSPTLKILCLLEISKPSDGKAIGFTKTRNLSSPIDFNTLRSIKELKNMEFMKSQQGSFFKLTSDEYRIIMDIVQGTNPLPGTAATDVYTKEDFLDEVFVQPEDYDRFSSLLLRKKNLILQGAPGVGKTFAAKRLAYAVMGVKEDSRVAQIQFHQNYSYEDFVMGYKPNDKGGFYLQEGIFYDFCKKAENDRQRPYFFIIDEINRGNLSKIFGELLMLIENDYRDKPIQLAYTKKPFSVPSNLYIIGMMNTADRSLAMIDYALRRRFSFFEMSPGFDNPHFKDYIAQKNDPHLDKLVKAIIELNKNIEADDSLGSGFYIGHSYLCNLDDDYDLENIVEYDIIPMLREYWFDNDGVFNREAQKLRDVVK